MLCLGGCRLGDVDAETSLHKVAVPLGHAPITGMGLVLNGGIGVAGKVFGPASDHILEVTMVTAEGDVVCFCPNCLQEKLAMLVHLLLLLSIAASCGGLGIA